MPMKLIAESFQKSLDSVCNAVLRWLYIYMTALFHSVRECVIHYVCYSLCVVVAIIDTGTKPLCVILTDFVNLQYFTDTHYQEIFGK